MAINASGYEEGYVAQQTFMTMPHLMNCGHADSGWCLACVKDQWSEMTHYRELLEQISKDTRRTRARRLAESGLMFWDRLMEEKRNGNFDAMNKARIQQSLPPEYIDSILRATAPNDHRP